MAHGISKEGHPSLIGRVGMVMLIAIESCLLATFLVVYLYYIGKSITGPYPADVLHPPYFASAVLLSSSVVVSLAVGQLRKNRIGAFAALWGLTMLQGAYFLYETYREWMTLIFEHQLTMKSNLFGSTFYALVGAHALHVVVGLVLMAVVLGLSLRGRIRKAQAGPVDLIAWYWHFVDVVWVFVFAAVYWVGR